MIYIRKIKETSKNEVREKYPPAIPKARKDDQPEDSKALNKEITGYLIRECTKEMSVKEPLASEAENTPRIHDHTLLLNIQNEMTWWVDFILLTNMWSKNPILQII